MEKHVWVVIPAHNESVRIEEVLSKLDNYSVVVVNDGSKDNTADIARKHTKHVLTHIINLGKGAALTTGCQYAIKQGADVIVTLDADAQHDPADIPRFLKELEKNDIVIGCRTLDKHMPAILRFGNWFISKLTTFLYGITVSDTQSGFRAFTAETYKKIKWNSTDYAMESEMLAQVGHHHLRYACISIHTVHPDKYKGTTVFDGVKIVMNIVWWRLRGT